MLLRCHFFFSSSCVLFEVVFGADVTFDVVVVVIKIFDFVVAVSIRGWGFGVVPSESHLTSVVKTVTEQSLESRDQEREKATGQLPPPAGLKTS